MEQAFSTAEVSKSVSFLLDCVAAYVIAMLIMDVLSFIFGGSDNDK